MPKRDRLRRARAMAAEFGDTARERAGDAYEYARDHAQEAYEAARERAEDAYEAIEDGIDEAHAYLKRQWRERPVAVAATALGVGLLIGMALRGSRR